jgi:hypothetical protein
MLHTWYTQGIRNDGRSKSAKGGPVAMPLTGRRSRRQTKKCLRGATNTQSSFQWERMVRSRGTSSNRTATMSTIHLSAETRDQTRMVRTAGVEPARGYPRQIFLPTTVFTADAQTAEAKGTVCGLDYPFIIVSTLTLDAARLVSTPSGLSPGLARDWHRSDLTLSFPRI